MYLLTRARHLSATGAAVVCGLGAACVLGAVGPAVALGSAAGADGSTPGDGLTLTPATGRSGASIAVRALCAGETEHGTVSSPAFARPVALHQGEGGAARAQATVKAGLTPGKSYVVTANCSETESLNSSFVHIGGRAGGLAAAGDDGSPQHEDGVGNAALAFGGGLATAGLAGYLLTVRRGSTGRNRTRPVRPARSVRPVGTASPARTASSARTTGPVSTTGPAPTSGSSRPAASPALAQPAVPAVPAVPLASAEPAACAACAEPTAPAEPAESR